MPVKRKTKTVKKAPAKKKTPAKAATTKPKKKTGKSTLSLLRGMKDVLPRDGKYWKRLYETARDISEAYCYGYIETPVVEEAKLFIRSIGKKTDVVEKEMYVFEDKDGKKIALRPEATASIVRSYISHGMQTLPQPVKVWYWGQMFRHDRPQAGRFRKFTQFGCEVMGSREAAVDAELIVVAYNYLLDLGIESQVHINSIGNIEDRERYLIELVGFLRSKRSYLCEDCKRRINKNPMRVLDCKVEGCKEVVEEAPQIIDWLSEDSKNFFMSVLEYLDDLHIPYVLEPALVRGLDYYSDTVFELYEDNKEKKSQNALGGGGRYDGLIGKLGGTPTPAAGFSLGIERVLSTIRRNEDKEGSSALSETAQLFFAQLGEQARARALYLIEELRRAGFKVKHNLGKPSLKAQLELANKYKVSHTLILGQKEVQDGTLIVRDMDSGIQEIIDQSKLKQEVKKLVGA